MMVRADIDFAARSMATREHGRNVLRGRPDWAGTVRGPAANDFRHSTTISSLYELPVGKGHMFLASMPPVAEAVLGGWQVNGIYSFRTGLPSSASLASNLVASRPSKI